MNAKKSLETTSSLPIFLDGYKLFFGRGINNVNPIVRTRGEMEPVLLDSNAKCREEKKFFEKQKEIPNSAGKESSDCYYMYRDIALEKDRKAINESGMRYDITILPPILLGEEYSKTFGHFHAKADSKYSYPEVYEVLHGKAHYLLQSEDSKRFIVIEAKAGDKVVIPPNFGHITVNPSKTVALAMSNWVYKGFESNYSEFKRRQGGMHYETTRGWIENKNYPSRAEIEFRKPIERIPELGLTKATPMYNLVDNLERLLFLKEPAKYKKIFDKLF